MVRTGKGKTALQKLGLLQPLSIVEIWFKDDDRKSIKTLTSIERAESLNEIPFDTVKTCIALFMAEVIGRSIHEEEANEKMFHFLTRSILSLDQRRNGVSNFHLSFMLEFSRHLGFYPHDRSNNEPFFDLIEGEFLFSEPIHPHVLSGQALEGLHGLMLVSEAQESIRIGNETRRILLQKLIDYYRLHLHGMKEITSHKVLEEVLS
jgi:DNA repair protein RecO (recombination protein O)